MIRPLTFAGLAMVTAAIAGLVPNGDFEQPAEGTQIPGWQMPAQLGLPAAWCPAENPAWRFWRNGQPEAWAADGCKLSKAEAGAVAVLEKPMAAVVGTPMTSPRRHSITFSARLLGKAGAAKARLCIRSGAGGTVAASPWASLGPDWAELSVTCPAPETWMPAIELRGDIGARVLLGPARFEDQTDPWSMPPPLGLAPLAPRLWRERGSSDHCLCLDGATASAAVSSPVELAAGRHRLRLVARSNGPGLLVVRVFGADATAHLLRTKGWWRHMGFPFALSQPRQVRIGLRAHNVTVYVDLVAIDSAR